MHRAVTGRRPLDARAPLEPADAARLHRLAARAERPPALVLDCSYVNGLSAIRRLARLGVPVLALDHRRTGLGMRSRLADPVLVPDPGSDEPAFRAALGRVLEALDRPAVAFPTHDDYLVAVTRAAHPLAILPFGPAQLVERIQSKRFQYEAAARAGVAIPPTFHPRSEEEAREAAGLLRYPAVMKPSAGAGFKRLHGRPLLEAHDPDELLEAYRAGAAFEPMLQERVPGGDELLVTVGSYRSAGGRVPAVFCGRKLRQMPAGAGTCSVGEARWDPQAVDAALALLRELGFHGISQVELKRDPRDESLRLMEVNARLWQWHGLAADAGVDLVAVAYADALGEPTPAAWQRPRRRRWVALAGHLRESARARVPLAEALGPLRPPFSEPVLSLRDPLPMLHQAYALARSARR